MKHLTLFLIAAAFALSACSEPPTEAETSEQPATEKVASGTAEAEPSPGKTAETDAGAEADAAPATETMTPKVRIETSAGNMVLQLDKEKAPETVENFLGYVKDGFYDNTVFHRVIEGFMIQGGGFGLMEDGKIQQKETKSPVQNEAKNGLKNARGTIAMARTGDPHSATAQFFINHGDNTNLDYPSFDGWGYAVFGEVVEGLEIVDKIASTETTTKVLTTKGGDAPMQDVPVEPIVIKKVSVVE